MQAPNQFELNLGFPVITPTGGSKWLPGEALFFAILPEPAVRARILAIAEAARRRYGLRGQARAADTLHVSLIGIGEFDTLPPAIASAAVRAGAAVTADAFDVTCDCLLSFKSPTKPPLVLRCRDRAPLVGLQASLAREMRLQGLRAKERWGFTPHVTLLNDRTSVPETPIDDIVRWQAREFVLIRSFRGEGRHEHLGRWPLACRDTA